MAFVELMQKASTTVCHVGGNSDYLLQFIFPRSPAMGMKCSYFNSKCMKGITFIMHFT